MRCRVYRLLLPLLVSACAVCAAAENSMARVSSEHYVIETDVSRTFAEVARRHMENMLSAYRRTLPQFDSPLEQKFRVRIFRSRRAYDRAVPDMVRGSSGVFVSHRRLLAAYLGDRVPEAVFRTLYHEGFHQFMFQAISRDAPLWVNEGLAEYFAEGTWNGSGFTLGQAPLKRLHVLRQAMRNRDIVSLPELLSMNTDKWVRNIRIDRSRASVQYSQVWSFIHFLLHGDDERHRGRLMDYLEDISDGKDADRAFRRHFGRDMQVLTRAWGQHVFALQPSDKSVCKRNLRVLMTMALEVWEEPARMKDVAALSGLLLDTDDLKWSAKGPYGARFGSENRMQSAGLFTCPADQSSSDSSYRMIRINEKKPALFCTNHPGIVLRAYMQPKGGRMRIRVAERVVDTLDADVRQGGRPAAK